MQLSVENLFIAVCTLSVLFVALGAYVFILRRRLKAIFKSDANMSLDKVMEQHLARTERVEQEAKRHVEELAGIRKDFLRAIQKVEITRFNSFEEAGTPQSFTLAALDGNRNGLILTYLHMRDTMRLYVKPVEGGTSPQKLSEEEETTLQKALRP